MARKIISTLVFSVLASGCASYSGQKADLVSPVQMETSSPIFLRSHEIRNYSCQNPEATLVCENQGSRVLQQRCTCRFY